MEGPFPSAEAFQQVGSRGGVQAGGGQEVPAVCPGRGRSVGGARGSGLAQPPLATAQPGRAALLGGAKHAGSDSSQRRSSQQAVLRDCHP